MFVNSAPFPKIGVRRVSKRSFMHIKTSLVNSLSEVLHKRRRAKTRGLSPTSTRYTMAAGRYKQVSQLRQVAISRRDVLEVAPLFILYRAVSCKIIIQPLVQYEFSNKLLPLRKDIPIILQLQFVRNHHFSYS